MGGHTVRTSDKKTISKKTMVSRLHFLVVFRESDAQSNQMSQRKMSSGSCKIIVILIVIFGNEFGKNRLATFQGIRPNVLGSDP